MEYSQHHPFNKYQLQVVCSPFFKYSVSFCVEQHKAGKLSCAVDIVTVNALLHVNCRDQC